MPLQPPWSAIEKSEPRPDKSVPSPVVPKSEKRHKKSPIAGAGANLVFAAASLEVALCRIAGRKYRSVSRDEDEVKAACTIRGFLLADAVFNNGDDTIGRIPVRVTQFVPKYNLVLGLRTHSPLV